MFDAMLSLLFYQRVANFYLLPGYSHMRPDKVVGLCKASLKRQNLYLPEQLAETMSQVKKMNAIVATNEAGHFKKWYRFLKKHFIPLPAGFTENYCFKFVQGEVLYKRLTSDEDDAACLLPHPTGYTFSKIAGALKPSSGFNNGSYIIK